MKRSPKGRLELTWMGKDSALIPVEDGKYDYSFVDPNDPRALEVKSIEVLEQVGEVDGPTGANENLLIIGDSGDALRSLGTIPEYHDKYAGQVKLVYIDPPFNTEQTFEHYADQLEHSIWLTMMRDRIRDIKPLLAEDASVWVHLDDAEVHRMRLLLDEEFGAEHFVAEIAWQKSDTLRNDSQGFSSDFDIILVYRTSMGWSPNKMPRPDSMNAIYKSPDGDPRDWFNAGPTAPGARTHQGMVYAVQNPVTGALHYPLKNRCWALGQADILHMLSEYADYELRIIDDTERRAEVCGLPASQMREDVPAIMLRGDLNEARESATERHQAGQWPTFYFTGEHARGGPGKKTYIPTQGIPPRTWWPNSEVGSNRTAKTEVKAFTKGLAPFSTPKPEALIQRVISLGTARGDLVLDCFAGSGTTAAVAHKMGRRWVTVELSESNVGHFTGPRLKAVVNGEDPGGVTSKSERVPVDDLPEGITAQDAQSFNNLLNKVAKGLDGLDAATLKALRTATKTRDDKTVLWERGGGFTVAKMGPSMYEVDDEDGSVYLSPEATNGAWSKAIAGQLKFTLTPDDPVFCGVRKRQRLAVIDGVADETVVRTVVEHLGEKEKAVIVAKGVLPEAGDLLQRLSPGSRIKKAPEDMFPKGTVN